MGVGLAVGGGVAVGGAGVSVGMARGLLVWQADKNKQQQSKQNDWTTRMVSYRVQMIPRLALLYKVGRLTPWSGSSAVTSHRKLRSSEAMAGRLLENTRGSRAPGLQ
ncbi:MAG: hypothetical protein PVJ75_16455 [Chloroflexota bacterium]|jgi:hypothetical protein